MTIEDSTWGIFLAQLRLGDVNAGSWLIAQKMEGRGRGLFRETIFIVATKTDYVIHIHNVFLHYYAVRCLSCLHFLFFIFYPWNQLSTNPSFVFLGIRICSSDDCKFIHVFFSRNDILSTVVLTWRYGLHRTVVCLNSEWALTPSSRHVMLVFWNNVKPFLIFKKKTYETTIIPYS